MASKLVFDYLLDIFPQIDSRILKAVAIEHYYNVDAAVESILLDVLPTINPSLSGVEPENQNLLLNRQVVAEEANKYSSSSLISVACEDVPDIDHTNNALLVKPTFLDEVHDGCSYSSGHGEHDHDMLSVGTRTGELICSISHREINVVVQSDNVSAAPISETCEDAVDTTCFNNAVCANIQDLQREASHDYFSVACGGDHQNYLCSDTNSSKEETTFPPFKFDDLHQEEKPSSMNLRAVDEMAMNTFFSEPEELGPSGLLESGPQHLIFNNAMNDSDVESPPSTIATRSSEIISVDFLEEFIADAKGGKEILASAMDSVLDMAREVELQEKAAEQAKEEALKGGVDVLSEVESLRQILQHAKETNDMHAGEVYGEKSILATEARELQSRLLNLSDEKDKSLAIIYEIQRNLKARLAAVEAERVAAEQQKIQMEENARKALAEQTLLMEKVVAEAKKLQQEAEENARLQEFLVERGRTVDILQGEIAVICEDVKLLKERIDGRLPIGSLKQTRSQELSKSEQSDNSTTDSTDGNAFGSNQSLRNTWNEELTNSECSEINTTNDSKGNTLENDLKRSYEDEWVLF